VANSVEIVGVREIKIEDFFIVRKKMVVEFPHVKAQGET
jgi:hypothetical protein